MKRSRVLLVRQAMAIGTPTRGSTQGSTMVGTGIGDALLDGIGIGTGGT